MYIHIIMAKSYMQVFALHLADDSQLHNNCIQCSLKIDQIEPGDRQTDRQTDRQKHSPVYVVM